MLAAVLASKKSTRKGKTRTVIASSTNWKDAISKHITEAVEERSVSESIWPHCKTNSIYIHWIATRALLRLERTMNLFCH